ncbi:alpha/beta hydrolase fold domain-containing protein [Sphingomonas sp.]|uniref:alpha/beta hydrolase n=1 Tax=Sphingomonas sp. TaxID=28214 RepID=UPI0025D6F8E1|nr:alpha/beta hydrolase fold domain-containing protein [Sphingomonas sp.]
MRLCLSGGVAALTLSMAAPAFAQVQSPREDGTVVVSDAEVPVSNLLSPEGAAYLRHLIVDKPFGEGPPLADIKAERARQDKIMHVFLDPMLKRYPVKITEERIGGIVTDVVIPAGGIAPENRNRVLINVHGGGFVTGARSASLVESVPLAAVMGIKVISIDYRMGPEYQFPAASEDVAAVYREVLKTYAPSHVVLYGCSAGGMLTAESIAWFQAHGLPNPAAIGVFCASLGKLAAGDSAALAMRLLGAPGRPAPAKAAPPPPPRGPSYLGGVADDNPLAYPLVSPAVLAKFPPTLFITGTRAFEFSAALNSHNQLAKAGVESQFHGWDGMFHGFFYNSEMPESREAYDIMAKFFDAHMAK